MVTKYCLQISNRYSLGIMITVICYITIFSARCYRSLLFLSPPPWSRHLRTDLIFIIYFNNRNVATNKARHGAVCAACVLPLVCGRFGDSSTAALCHAAFGRILNYIKYCGLYNLLITRMSTNINCMMLLIETLSYTCFLTSSIVTEHSHIQHTIL